MALGNCADMMSMLSIETKHLINKGFHNLKNPFFVNLSEKNAFSMNNKINHMSVAFYVAPYINAICRSGTKEEKTLTFESMLKHKAFKMLPSTKRGHFLG
jgi:single-stranded DNA-specific DHH superfamily exonuclease